MSIEIVGNAASAPGLRADGAAGYIGKPRRTNAARVRAAIRRE